MMKQDLTGFIDIHLHTSPDVRPRKLDDLAAARQAASEKMKAIVLKNHVACTSGRAAVVSQILADVKVFGSIVLNEHIGGINPLAVDSAIKMGAKIVWLPTISAENHRRYHGEPGGILISQDEPDIINRLSEIIELMRDADRVLATGHISADEISIVVNLSKEMGLKKCIVTHPEVPWIDMSIDQQVALRERGAFFERCYASTMKIGGGVPITSISEAIFKVGCETTIISTDFGADVLDAPIAGYKNFLKELEEQGLNRDQLKTMGIKNPSLMLGID